MTPLIIAPSLLSADFTQLGAEVKTLAAAGADWLHLDVMDGNFVPNLTFGPPIIKALRPLTALPFDVHLMVEKPLELLDAYKDAGASHITIHAESDLQGHTLEEALRRIRAAGMKSGVSIKPNTPFSAVKEALKAADILLIMTVEPGFGGQGFIKDLTVEIEQARTFIDNQGLETLIHVDGGVNIQTIRDCAAAGANAVVSGSAILNGDRSVAHYQANIRALHKASF